MENALFYTFSTIPQTLAAAIALLGAFVLYRLQSINAEIEEKSSTVQQLCINQKDNGLWELHVNESYDKVFDNSRNFQPLNENDLRLFNLHHSRLGNLLRFKKSLFSSLNLSLWVTVSLITFSVIVLPFTPAIKTYTCVVSILFVFAILWFILCLFCYAKLVKNTLRYKINA